MNIKCRKAGLSPSVVVAVATIRAMKMNGGVAKSDLGDERRSCRAGVSKPGKAY